LVGWLMMAGIFILLFGMSLILSRKILIKLRKFLEEPILFLDDKLKSIGIIAGALLSLIGGWIVSVAFNYPQLWYLHPIGLLILCFGLLYLFLPDWLSSLSRFFDRLLLSADEIFIEDRRNAGLVLIGIAIFILISAYLIIR